MEPIPSTSKNNERWIDTTDTIPISSVVVTKIEGSESFQMEEIVRYSRPIISKSNFDGYDYGDVLVSVPKSKRLQQEYSDGDDEFSTESDDSDIEYFKKVIRPRPKHFIKDKGQGKKQNVTTTTIGNNSSRISDDHFNFPDPNLIKVTRTDIIFSFIVLFTSIGDFITDFGLIWWHYSDDFKWVSTFTCIIMIFGAGGMLNHFSHVESNILNQLFLNGKRVKILTSCFPFLGSVISSYQSVLTSFKARKEEIFCLQFFGVEDFSLNLLRIQSFFQSAPQATFQLVVLMYTMNQISSGKAIFSIVGVVLSLSVMTIANLPYRNQNSETMVIPAAYGAKKRLFIGCRMFSSFGSRAMSIGYLFMGLSCLLEMATFPSVLIGIIILFLPRLIFTFVDYILQLMKGRKNRNPDAFQTLTCCGTFIGYFATIFIPMSDPLWVFWYVWGETALYVLFGNITGWVSNCISNTINAFYTGTFIIVFIIIPIVIPYARLSAQRKKHKRLESFFDEKNTNSSPGRISRTSSTSNNDVP